MNEKFNITIEVPLNADHFDRASEIVKLRPIIETLTASLADSGMQYALHSDIVQPPKPKTPRKPRAAKPAMTAPEKPAKK